MNLVGIGLALRTIRRERRRLHRAEYLSAGVPVPTPHSSSKNSEG
jgi:hypothetical protein